MSKKIKLVIFDAYGVTLNEGYPNTMKFLAKKYDKDKDYLYKIFYTKYLNLAANRKITQKQAWIQSVKETNLPIDYKEVKKIHYSLMKKNAKVIKLADEIGKETNTLLLSKNTRSQLFEVNHILDFKKHFKNVINTWELGIPKASKETCEFLLKRFKVKPEEVIYIDDQESNLTDAKKIGIKTIFYQNFEQFKKDFYKIYK
ncbi:MAG: HAD-IA family hydrolase [Nanoarchaeota archaeon]|nr:HAD-IA family hydrolase [Nanoarchaeota archaeon]MBU1854290.1 HAD-IA family hydrolase [Nanoarchaeota archaeon]